MLVVANRAAGSTERDAVAAAVAVLRAAGPVEIAETGEPADLHRTLDERDGRQLVVAGGDGSLHALVAALHARGELADCLLGLIPLGTGNDLARGLGIPLDPGDAARVVLAGRRRRLDLIVDDAGGVVLNAVHLGVGAQAARAAATWKPRLGRFAYPVGSLVAGLRTRGWRLDIDVDGQPMAERSSRVLMVAVANGPSIAGGMAHLHPDAAPDDGMVEVVVSSALGPLARVGYAVALMRGGHLARADIATAHGRRVSVSGEPFLTVADGEVDGPLAERNWAVRPGAWQVIARPASDAAGPARPQRAVEP
jgi:diacylglycerol kinase (ATP)